MGNTETSAPTPPPPFPDHWEQLSGDEKYQFFANGWASTQGKPFASDEMAERYQKSAQRMIDVIALKEPDRVPAYLLSEGLILNNAGIQPIDVFYNQDKYLAAGLKMHVDFDLDYSVLSYGTSGKALDTLGVRLIRWPGSASNPLPDDTHFQYVEDEYMRVDEYDELIHNTEGYVMRKYIPRICSQLGGLAHLPSGFNFLEPPLITGSLFGLSKGTPARQALDTLLEAADDCTAAMVPFLGAVMQIAFAHGAPPLFGGISFVPFDLLGDTMRCTMGIMKDLYRYPEKVIAATQALVPMSVQLAVQTAYVSRTPYILIPLHKGADGFMSPAQFEKFYWPTLKASFLGMIDAGLIPVPFVEGAYNQRLDSMAADPLPKGKTAWIFDRTDMQAAKEKVGRWACVAGNVPASLFSHGSPAEMQTYCQGLIETCAPGGGFFMAPGAVVDHAKAENVNAFLGSVKKFG